MQSASRTANVIAISTAAAICQRRPISAEPLFFALMCRHLWGSNAAKELQFIVGGKERTCRSHSSGDSIPQSDVLLDVLSSPNYGREAMDYLMRDNPPLWWLDLMRAERIAKAEDAIDRS